jgi:hypothetical protein
VPAGTTLTTSTTGNPIAGTTVTLTGTDAFGKSVSKSTTTSSSGQYSFTGLNPSGSAGYTVTETPPASDTHLGQTSTTSGAVTTTNSVVSKIVLTTNGATSTDNYFETVTVSINGTDFLDLNGDLIQESGEPGISGTTITLTGTNAFGNSVKETTTTNATGAYSFTGLNPSNSAGYTVTETPPSDLTHEGQTSTTSGAVTTPLTTPVVSKIVLTTNGASSTDIFAEEGTPTTCCNLTGITFSVYNPKTGVTTNPTDLGGNTQQGDTVSVTFTVPSGDDDEISLVSYTAPQPYYSATSAYLQQVSQSATEIFGPGTYSLPFTVTLPSSYYQVDFVCGTVIAQLGLSPSDFYHAQNRMISSDNGGTNLPSGMSSSAVGSGQSAATSFWINSSTGQTLINSLNGGSSATKLGNWLATISPNLFGSQAGQTNSQIASYMKTLNNGNSNQKAVAQVLGVALAAYVTDSSLAGNTAAAYGFTVSTYGTGVNTDNVGSNGSALGLSNNTYYSIVTLLAAIDSDSSNGSIDSSQVSAASTICTAINKAGGIS